MDADKDLREDAEQHHRLIFVLPPVETTPHLVSFCFFFCCIHILTRASMSSAVLERRLSVQDVRDAPPLAAYNHSPHVPEATRYIPRLSPLYRRAPVRFSIQPTMQDTFECSPGSIFQGTIHLQLAEPLAAQHLKLSFRGLGELSVVL